MKRIVACTPDRDTYIKPLEVHLDFPLEFIRKWDWELIDPKQTVAIIFLADWIYEIKEMVERAKDAGIPTILMMDGTIEWKHYFENPKWTSGGNEAPYFPVYCDKIFVPGLNTYNFLHYFGNAHKCEITGLPRMDSYANFTGEKISNEKPVIGVMSGNTAGYTPQQMEETKKLFNDIHEYAEKSDQLKVLWRLRKNFDQLLPFKIENHSEGSLADYLKKVDAVICQPSTAAYEAMLMNKPVALADYSIAPNYMHAAWEIHSKDHIAPVLEDIAHPGTFKLLLQEQLLQETMAYSGHSSEIAAKIINKMIQISIQSSNKPIIYPDNLFIEVLNDLRMAINESAIKIVSGNSLFNRKYDFSEQALVVEKLVKAEKYIQKLQIEINKKKLSYWIIKLTKKIFKIK